MHRNKKAESRSDKWEIRNEVLVTFIAGVAVLALGAPDKWLAAIYCTVVPFGGTISLFRRRWSSGEFWTIIAGTLVIHFVLVVWVFAWVLRRRTDVALVVCIPFIFLEGALLYYGVQLLETKVASLKATHKSPIKR